MIGRMLHRSNAWKSLSLHVRSAATSTPNTKPHRFRLLNTTEIKELDIVAQTYVHEVTGSKYIHLASDDSDNVFSVAFPTNPTDSTGVAHILEHTVLCGSRKYPVRDPFFNMLKRSLKTYMNAWTGSDFTAYPFSTQNKVDFYNLMSIYTDAVFYPMINELDFRQEGYRLEYKDNDPNNELLFKGVVLNEMKGVLADSSSLFSTRLQTALYPTTTYHHVSGGDPPHITSLSYEALLQFHHTHYHPSNAHFFTYGNMDVNEHLKAIDEVLKPFKRQPTTPPIPAESRYSSPKRVTTTGPVDPMGGDSAKQTKMIVAWLVNDTKDVYESISLSILSDLFFSGPAAPFNQALLVSKLAPGFAPSTGYDRNTKEASFGIGVQGISTENVGKIEEVIQDTLVRISQEGFPQDRIDAVLHQIELGRKERGSNYGINLFGALVSRWCHGYNPIDSLFLDEHLDRMKTEIAAGPFFQNLVKKYFLENPHKVVFTMEADPEYSAKLEAEEKSKLENTRKYISNALKRQVVEQSLALKKAQETKPDVSCLPTISVSDIQRPIPHNYPTIMTRRAGVPVMTCPTNTNGVTYLRMILDVPDMTPQMRLDLPFVCSALTKIGTDRRDYMQLSKDIKLHTGGVSVKPYLMSHYSDNMQFYEGVQINATSLDRNFGKLLEIMQDVLLNTRFADTSYLKTLLMQRVQDAVNSIAHDGSSYASSYASSFLSPVSLRSEVMYGLTQVNYIQSLESEPIENIVERFRNTVAHILSQGKLRVALTSTAGFLDAPHPEFDDFLASLNPKSGGWEDLQSIKGKASGFSNPSFFSLPLNVNFVARAVPSVPSTHPDFAKIRILTRILSSCYLHNEIREKGGAYGSGSSASNGLITFHSYYDPNSFRTIEVYDNSLDWINRSLTDQDIDEAKISLFSALDAPVPPPSRGLDYFASGITPELRQTARDQLFAVSKRDVIEVAEKYLGRDYLKQNASDSIVGSETVSVENTAWTVLKKDTRFFPETLKRL
eukprot:TRINITY_DN8276_c0_g5_i1.p1 TRINITY_DN8276_c0_g5~~TRINITY_DN8276_c0_g5_i1.p1  ORF type:complete len:1004 (-),score=211.10 TRINITY_DN8276_c0_g5_i1:177-3188(-)